jgi:hypothetical protein
MSAMPGPPGTFGAITPVSWKREWAAGTGTDGAAITAGVPNRRVRSARVGGVSPTATVWAGAPGARTTSRRTQTTALAATRAQITNADSRAGMRRL